MTPEEKAKQLGVPVYPAVKRTPPMKPIGLGNNDEAKRRLMNEMQKVVGICGACGKEITQAMRKEPCGNNECPFGMLSNHISSTY